MADIYSKEKRSYLMSLIRSQNTKPEIMVRKYLFSKGLRFRVNVKKLPGTPDIVLPKYRTVIFIHGCFWHGHGNCKIAHLPKTRTEWWEKKINRNIERDNSNRRKLKGMGWHTMVVWECQLVPKQRQTTMQGIVDLLDKAYLEDYKIKATNSLAKKINLTNHKLCSGEIIGSTTGDGF
ncbi:very short patch repair endonuclease [Culturomica sp.]|uniref:very short patch repair endonuclease n=1 Tax=Culturomica sp. TaxID=1926652 RepID=UPI000E9D194E|nr:very short patch repair endonuclease [Culturomica sp.]HBO27782.1 very short patch repair endonuclease [Culturomica sp.]